MAYSPAAKALAASRGGGLGVPELWQAAASRPKSGKSFIGGSAGGDAAGFSPNGKILVTISSGGVAALWDVATGRLIGAPITDGDANAINAVAFSPDGKTIVTGIVEGTIQLWSMANHTQTGRSFTNGNGTGANAVAFSPDSKTLAIGSDDGVRLLNLATGHLISGLLTDADGDTADAVAFSPDGKTLAVGSLDGTMPLWDVADGPGQQIGSPISVPGGVNWLAFSPDGKTLAAAGEQGTTLWNVSYLTNPLTQLCARVGGSITPTEWAAYVQAGITNRNACPRTP